ncbi:MAG: D-alanine--D-alanine ligase [Pseudomonadota bacterium]
MKIGLTYDLRSEYLAVGFSEEETAEFDRDDTVEAIERALESLGHRTERIGNVKRLIERLATGDRWDLVFNIAEGLLGIGREAQVPAVLDAYDIAYTFSDPLVMSLTLHKGITKRVIRDAGLPTAEFEVVTVVEDVELVRFSPPYFIKPVAEGTSKGVGPSSVVRRREDLADRCAAMLTAYRQPVLVEQFLPGREFTVGILGTCRDAEVLGTVEVCLRAGAEPEAYSYINKKRYEALVEYCLVDSGKDSVVKEAETVALESWRVLGCRDAGRVDLRCDAEGRPVFIEVNPLAGLHPEHSDLPIIGRRTGMSYGELVRRIVNSAVTRLRGDHPGH